MLLVMPQDMAFNPGHSSLFKWIAFFIEASSFPCSAWERICITLQWIHNQLCAQPLATRSVNGTVIVESCKLAAVKLPSAKNNFRRLEAVRREMVLPTRFRRWRQAALCLLVCGDEFPHHQILIELSA